MNLSIPRRALLLALLAGLMAAAHAAEPAAGCRYVMVAKLPIRYSESFRPMVDGAINQQPAVMLVDTGAGSTSLSRVATDRLNLSLHSIGRYAVGIGGATQVYGARVKDFSVGASHSGRVALTVIGETGGRPDYDAIVGADFLLQTDMEIALADKEIKFFRPTGCKDIFLGYWDPNAQEIPFSSSLDESLNPHFEVELNGKKMVAIIDTGASRSTVFVKAAERAGVRTDSPGVRAEGNFIGVGSNTVARWTARFDTFAIGSETVRNAAIDIMDTPSVGTRHVDIHLGADFLRAHRVLFAMSQERLVISYTGGEVFPAPGKGIAPWLRRDADDGNPHAQYLMAVTYQNGSGVARDSVQAAAWLAKAAGQGHPQANLVVGHNLLRAKQFAAAATRLRGALDKLPDERTGALWLFLARQHLGDGAGAASELSAAFAADKAPRWPAPVADYYLGRIGSDALLAQAAKEAAPPLGRSCEAAYYIAELHRARGETEAAKSLIDATRADCARRPSNPGDSADIRTRTEQ